MPDNEWKWPPAFLELAELFELDLEPFENPKRNTVAYWAKANVAAQFAVANTLRTIGATGQNPPPEEFAPWDVVTDTASRIADGVSDVAETAGDAAEAMWTAADGVVKIAGFGAAVVAAAGNVAAAATDVVEAGTELVGNLADQLIPDQLPGLSDVGECIGESGDDALLGAVVGGTFGGICGLNGGQQFLKDVAEAGGTIVTGKPITEAPSVLFNPDSGGMAIIRKLIEDPDGVPVGVEILSPVAQGGLLAMAGAITGGVAGGAVGTMACLLHRAYVGNQVPVVAHDRDGIAVSSYWRSRPSVDSVAGSLAAYDGVTFADRDEVEEFNKKENAMGVKMSFGDHPEDTPTGMLTDVVFDELVKLNHRTDDGRLIRDTGFGVRDLPLAFSAMFTTQHGPGEAPIVGVLDEVNIHDNGIVSGRGWLMDDPVARRAGRFMKANALRGNSVELSAEEVEIDLDEDSMKVMVDFVKSKLTATTAVANPAMDSATVRLGDPDFDFGSSEPEEASMAASLGSFTDLAPAVFTTTIDAVEEQVLETSPVEWFSHDPVDEPHPVHVDEDGRVTGYLATWGTQHLGAEGVRLTPPKSQTDYAYFRVGEVLTSGGLISTGPLVLGGDHADLRLGWRDAIDFYAATSEAWADVAIGEDEHGIWIAGMVRPGVPDEVIHAGRASALSGDWRRIGGNLELVAALSVNTPGFPIPAPTAYAVGGPQTALCSAGVLKPELNADLNERGYLMDPQDLEDLAAAGRFVRRFEARELASQIGDGKTLVQIADDLAEAIRRT